MIVTVTPNPAVDKTVRVRNFTVGGMNRAAVERLDVGGKGINVARNLARLGCEVIATGFLGAADTHNVAAALAAEGVHPDFVRVPGDVRVNLKILDSATRVETEINECGDSVDEAAVHALARKLGALAPRCAVMVFSGSLPPGVPEDLYARAIQIAAAAGARTILDTAGAALHHGLAAGPDLVKPNRVEAEGLLRMRIRDDAELIVAARQLLERGARTAVISLSADGALSGSVEGLWRARPPAIAPWNTVGAGDALVAALAYALSRSLPAAEALRLATAFSCAAAESADPLPRRERAEEIVPQVRIEAVAAADAPSSLPSSAP